jgi:hypothetical protein
LLGFGSGTNFAVLAFSDSLGVDVTLSRRPGVKVEADTRITP